MKAIKVYGLIGAMALTAVCATAFAQGGPPDDDQNGPPPQHLKRQGGPGDGGPGGRGMRRMGPGGEPLVLRPDVQKELKLTEEQIEKIRKIMPGPPRRMGGGPEGGPGDAGPRGERRERHDGPPEGDGERGHPHGDMDRGPGGDQPRMRMGGGPGGGQIDGQLEKVLSDGQMKRLKELRLQRQGAMALMQKDIADKVGLSDDDRDKIREIIEEDMESLRPDRDGPPDHKQMEARHAKLSEKILDSLSSKQRSKWNSLAGKPFKFDANWHPQPPEGGPRDGQRRRSGGENPPPPPSREEGELEAAMVMEAMHNLYC